MNEKRKAWCKKYEVKIVDGGFIDKWCLPEHVECILPNKPGQKPYFIGFDGKPKSYEELTEEEKQDYKEQGKDTKKLLNEVLNKMKYRERTRRIKNICDAEQEKNP